jgi:hypothetical protein
MRFQREVELATRIKRRIACRALKKLRVEETTVEQPLSRPLSIVEGAEKDQQA